MRKIAKRPNDLLVTGNQRGSGTGHQDYHRNDAQVKTCSSVALEKREMMGLGLGRTRETQQEPVSQSCRVQLGHTLRGGRSWKQFIRKGSRWANASVFAVALHEGKILIIIIIFPVCNLPTMDVGHRLTLIAAYQNHDLKNVGSP